MTLKSVLSQRWVNYEVVVSDNTHSSEVSNLCLEFERLGMKISYFKFDLGSGLSQNLNHAVKVSRGQIIKILFQDDYLLHETALFHNRLRLFLSFRQWLVTGTLHYDQEGGVFKNPFFPKPSKKLLSGINTISSPSVVMLPRKKYLEFSDQLHFLVDCEWYLRMSHNFGRPIFSNSLDVVNRLHRLQSTHEVSMHVEREKYIASNMHSFQRMKKSACICAT